MIYSDVLQRLKNFNVVIDSDYKVSAVSNNLLESDIGITILNMHVNELFSKKVLFDDDKQGKENIENSEFNILEIVKLAFEGKEIYHRKTIIRLKIHQG